MKGVLRKIGMAVMSVMLALIVFRLLPAQTSYAAALPQIPASVDYFHDNSGYYFNGDDSVGPGYSWIGTYFDSEFGNSVTVLQFDLSSIPASDMVSSANLKLFVPYVDYDHTDPTPLFVNVYGSNDDAISESSQKIPTQDVTIVSEQTGITQGQFLNIDLTSYISSQVAAGDKKATLVLTSKNTPGKSNQFAINSNNAPSNKPALEVTTATNAKVASVTAPPNGTYTTGQNLNFTVNFDRVVNVTDAPSIPLTVGSTGVQATYVSGTGTTALTFRYTVASGQLDTDGVSLGGSISLNGGTIKNASNEDSILTLNNIGSLSNVKVDAVAPTVSSVSVPANATYGSGQSLTFAVNFNEPVNAAGGTPSLGLIIGSTNVQANYASGSGTSSLVFRYDVLDGQSDSDGITVSNLSLNGATIKDLAGNAAALTLNSVGNTAGVRVDAVAPAISSVDMPSAGTYKTGDQLNFTVHYNENANVTGSPYLPVTIGASSRQATYVSGSGTQNLLFRYTVQAGDLDADGVQPGANLVLNGGSIRDAANNNASLALSGIITNTVLVDAVAPTISSVSVPANKTYLAGQDLEFTVQYDELVAVTGTPFLPITIGSKAVQASYVSGSGTANLLFRYTVQAGDYDGDGIAVASGLNLNGGTVRDVAANNANLALNNAGSTTAVLVDATAPTVSSVDVPLSQTYGPEAILDFRVHFSKKVVIAGGTPFIPLTIGSSTVQAQYLSGAGTDTIVFSYVVQAGDNDNNGIEAGSAISLNGSTIKDESGNHAILTLVGVGSTTAVLVDTAGPAVTSVDVPADSSYKAGSALEFTVHYSENVAVTGIPSLPITIGSSTVQAAYVSGAGTKTLLFRYTVLSGQEDLDGIEVGSALALNGGTLADAAGNEAGLTLTAVDDTNQVLVDAVAPSAVSIDVPAAGIYKAGSSLTFTIHYDEKVAVTGTPYITITIGSTAVHAVYASGSGTKDITFAYSVQNGDEDTDGIELGTVALNGGALNDAAGNAASLSLTAAGSTNAVLVDTIAPTISSVDVPDNGIYNAGDKLKFIVHYDEKITVTGGTPFLTVTIGSAAVHAVYASGSGTSSLLFEYDVQAGDNDQDGIQAGSVIQLNGAAIQDAAGNAAVLAVTTESTSGVLVDTAAPAVTSVQVPSNGNYSEGSTLNFTVHYNEKVTIAGSPTLPITIGSSTVQAAYVTGTGTDSLVFSYTVLAGQVDLDGISVGASLNLNSGTIADAAGNAAELALASVGSTSAVLVDAIAPSIESVDLPANDTYVAGEQLDITIHYDEAVTVTGTPSISMTIGSATVQAQYVSGTGTTDLLFRYTVKTGDNDANGIEVGALNLNGGTLKDATGNNAAAVLGGLGSTAGVKVDAVAPAATSLDVPAEGTYKAGEALTFTVHYDEDVYVTGGTPYLSVTIGTTPVQASYVSGTGTNALVFRYTVLAGQEDTNGIEVGNAVNPNGASIQDAAGNATGLALTGAGSISTVRVDAIVPTVTSVAVPANGTYKEGDQLDFTVNFNESVTVSGGTPYLTITIGSATVHAPYVSGTGTSGLLFRYTVQAGDLDANGIVAGTDIALNGSTLKDAAGNAADVTLASVGSTSAVLVDAIAPSIESVDLPANNTYVAGEQLVITIHYDEAVTVTGTPSISMTIGSATVQAQYVSGTGTTDLLFRYTVKTGDNDANGIEVGALSLNGGTLKDATGNNAEAVLSGLGSTAAVKVDAVAPAVTSLDVPADDTYKAGEALTFTVHYDEAVNVTGGTPYLSVTIGTTPVQAAYVSGTGTNELVFRYTVLAGQEDTNGIEVGSSVNLNGAAINDAAGNTAGLALTGAGSISTVLVDAIVPTVSSVSVPANGTYKEGDQLDFTVTLNENVALSGGTPYLTVTIGTTDVHASYVSGAGTNALLFRYAVQAGDHDTDGIAVGNAIALNGSTLKDAAGNAADLTLASVGSTSAVLVDAIAPSIESVDLPANDTYVAGEQLDITIHYDEAVTVTGTPSISMTIGSATVQAQYVSGTGTTDLLFRYTVKTGDNDANGIEVGALNLNGGTLKDATGNNAEAVLSGLGSTAGVKVDAVAPSITQVEVPANGSYKAGSNLQFTVHFSENVHVTGGTPELDLKLDGKTVQAAYVSGSGTNALVFQYEVQAGDTDSDGIELAAGISLNGAAIADQAGNAAVLTLANPGDASAVRIDTTVPVVSLVSMPADGMYHAGANLDFIVKTSEPVILNAAAGKPYMEVQVGSAVVKAEYLEAVSSSEFKFRYTVRLEDQDSDGISVDSGALALNGAVISDAAGNGFSTTLNHIGATGNIKVSNNFSIALSETNWTNKDVTVTVTTDPDNKIEYKLGSSGSWTSYTAPVLVTQEGLTAFYARVIDPDNHVSEVKSVEVKIDKTAPVIVLNGNNTVIVYNGSTYTEQGAKVQDANPADPLATVTGTVNTTTLGTYTLQYNAVDLAGNHAVEVIRYVNVVNKPVSNTNVRQVTVEIGDPDHPQVIVQIDIVREVIGGKKVDTVVMNEDKIKQAVASAIGAHQGTIRIIVDDIPGDPADEVKVKLTVNSIKYLLDSSIQVVIQTENATLHLSTEALGAMKGSQEFFFDILPIRKKDEQDAVKDRTVNAEAIRKIANSGKVTVIGMPMTIETNLPKVAVQVTFPLDSNVIPSDLNQRKLFLASLGVYIEHSDGEKVFQRGKIVYNDKGYPVGIEIEVNKFSTFTIVSAEGASVHHNAYMTGYSDGTFRPNQSVTRAEMSTMLYRLLSGTLPGRGSVTAFKDVSGSFWASEAIRWGQQVGILNGYPDHTFKPNATITRAEMAAIIVKWLQLDPDAANPAFRDAKGHWASVQIAAAAKLGYMTGYSDGTFRPDQPLTRAEAVVIVNRILGRGPLTGVTTPTWKDVSASFWAFGAIEEASRSHDAARDSGGSETFIPE
ncbi:S-layer homology domain-containing protein [Paenibacillus sp. JDR-2]|uniref:S-layer homology domain-containing protein n=1 Tax=Paenibacillus sp. (strain JDR-2) TaxID=324057 RepID=UPI000166A507|nr:S-layer homology domain-containing protein [Paenibacillus sp. JDR-2]ACT00085.1 S-layer domain protein [Paenibacillus sp. JDR-2]